MAHENANKQLAHEKANKQMAHEKAVSADQLWQDTDMQFFSWTGTVVLQCLRRGVTSLISDRTFNRDSEGLEGLVLHQRVRHGRSKGEKMLTVCFCMAVLFGVQENFKRTSAAAEGRGSTTVDP